MNRLGIIYFSFFSQIASPVRKIETFSHWNELNPVEFSENGILGALKKTNHEPCK